MVALHILLTRAMAIPYKATKYSIEWYALYNLVDKHLLGGIIVAQVSTHRILILLSPQ